MDRPIKSLRIARKLCILSAVASLWGGSALSQTSFTDELRLDTDEPGKADAAAISFATQVKKRHFIPVEGLPLPGFIVSRVERDPKKVLFRYCIGGDREISEELLTGTNETCDAPDNLNLEQLEWANVVSDTKKITVLDDSGKTGLVIRFGEASDSMQSSVMVTGEDLDLKEFFIEASDLPPVSMTVGPEGAEIRASAGFDWQQWISSIEEQG